MAQPIQLRSPSSEQIHASVKSHPLQLENQNSPAQCTVARLGKFDAATRSLMLSGLHEGLKLQLLERDWLAALSSTCAAVDGHTRVSSLWCSMLLQEPVLTPVLQSSQSLGAVLCALWRRFSPVFRSRPLSYCISALSSAASNERLHRCGKAG